MAREVKRLTSKSNIAKEYINKNIFKKSKDEILKQIIKDTGLSYKTIESIYIKVYENKIDEVVNEIEIEERIQQVEKPIEYYKGRDRKFFIFDDSNLYRNLKGRY